jgi:serine/threonine protein kinase
MTDGLCDISRVPLRDHKAPFPTNTYAAYTPLLQEYGFSPTLKGPWAYVGKTGLVQGWKLHLSTIPTEAIQLLHRVLPVLAIRGAVFKVVRDSAALEALLEGSFGPQQIGKAITIYPDDDDDASLLASELIPLTDGFNGPKITTDIHLGGLLYARFGGFNPQVRYDRLGDARAYISLPDGSIIPDQYQPASKLLERLDSPFKNSLFQHHHGSTSEEGRLSASGRIVGSKYLLLSPLRFRGVGSTWLALDVRQQSNVSPRVLKQGRRWCLTDQYGRDIRARLERQATLHGMLSGSAPVPGTDGYFEHDGDGYLVLNYVEGIDLETAIYQNLGGRRWAELDGGNREILLRWYLKIVEAVAALHGRGIIHRDLTPSNIQISTDCVYLLDLELAHEVDSATPAFGLGTLGFMSPQQSARQLPRVSDDYFAVGCLGLFILTGLDPARVIKRTFNELHSALAHLTGGAPQSLLESIAQNLSPNYEERIGLEKLGDVIDTCITECAADQQKRRNVTSPCYPSEVQVAELIESGLHGMINNTLRDPDCGLWASAEVQSTRQREARLTHVSAYALYRHGFRGVAGPTYVLSRLARFGWHSEALRQDVRNAVDWLYGTPADLNPPCLPGLFFGEAGVAVAIAESIAANLVTSDPKLTKFVEHALTGACDWPDMTHGAAGQGVASLYCARVLGEPNLAQCAHRYADFLIASQEANGAWRLPPGVDGMSGEILTGFSHGVAGIMYFLVEYAREFSDVAADDAWRRASSWLISCAKQVNSSGALNWPYSDQHVGEWHWWNHGAPGIALAFIRAFECTGECTYAEIAARALRSRPSTVRTTNLSQCQGVAGLGEVYLEAWRALGGEEWLLRATDIALTLDHLGRRTVSDATTWLVEDDYMPTADLMAGSGGIVHFLLRYYLKGSPAGPPLLLDAVNCS